jgi:hypothetical protein
MTQQYLENSNSIPPPISKEWTRPISSLPILYNSISLIYPSNYYYSIIFYVILACVKFENFLYNIM